METLTITTAARRITRTCREYGPAYTLWFDPDTGALLKAHEASLQFIKIPPSLRQAISFPGGKVVQRYVQARLTARERFPGDSPESQLARHCFVWEQMETRR